MLRLEETPLATALDAVLMSLDLKKLDTFRLVARFGSLSRVAAQRGLTLPAISIQIKNLETDLGVKLFDHRPNRVTLTQHGRILLKEANKILDSVVRAREALTAPEHGYEGNIMVSIAGDLGRLFTPRIAGFVRQHPNLNVTILARRTRESLALVLSGEIDIAIGFFPKVPRGVDKQVIFDTNITLMMPRDHALARRKSLTLSDVFAHRVVARRLLIDDAVIPKTAPLYLPNLIAVDTCQVVMDFVEHEQGIGLVHSVCASADPHKKLFQVDMTRFFANTEICLLTRSNAALGPAAQALVDAVTDNSIDLRASAAKPKSES